MYGNIVLAGTKGQFVPNAIKWFTVSVFSHSLVTMPDVLGTPMCIEAAESGVDFTRFDTSYIKNEEQGYEVWRIKISQDIKDEALVKILSDLEIGYGFLQFLFFIVRRICRLFDLDIKSKNNWFRKEGMICSQLCVAYLEACGLGSLFSEYGKGSIAPQDIKNAMVAHPELFEMIESVRL